MNILSRRNLRVRRMRALRADPSRSRSARARTIGLRHLRAKKAST